MKNSKKTPPKDWVKLADFAKITGLSSKTVARAIREGRIPATCVTLVGTTEGNQTYYLNPAEAVREWLGNIDTSKVRSRQIHEKLSVVLLRLEGKDTTTAKKKSKQPPPTLSLAEIRLREAYAKARLSELTLAKTEGELVSRAEVESSLFTLAKELRDALLAIPDRIIDNIMAAENRTQGHRVLYNALADELERLSDAGIKKLNNGNK